jgi:mono/diheme cytochrome c family protein
MLRRRGGAGVVLIAFCALLLAACGGGGSGSTTTDSTTAAETGTTTSSGITTTAAGDASKGREVFISSGCGGCHTLKDAGADASIGPNLNTDLTTGAEAAGQPIAEFVHTSIVDPDVFVIPPYSVAVMPSTYATQLSDEQIADLVAYIVQNAQ